MTAEQLAAKLDDAGFPHEAAYLLALAAEVAALRAERDRLQQLVQSLTERVAAASEVLSHLAERKGGTMSRTGSALQSKAQRVTRAIVDDLYTNAFGERGKRLAIKADDEHDLGGWCKEAAESRVYAIVIAALKDGEPVPRPLFEAAARVLRMRTADWQDVQAIYRECRENESWGDTAERIIRQAAAGGITEEKDRA